MNKAVDYVIKIVDDFPTKKIKIADVYDFSVYELIQQITLYIISKYVGGMKDSVTQKRLRFRNIGNGMVDIEFRAKNIDTKNIIGEAIDEDYVFSLIVNRELQNWMKNNYFGKTIDDYQKKKSQYGNVMLKKWFTYEDGVKKLNIEPTQWTNTVFDPQNPAKGGKIEKYTLTAFEVGAKRGVWDKDQVDACLEKFSRMSSITDKIDIISYEGEMTQSYITGKEEDKEVKRYRVIIGKVVSDTFLLHSTPLTEDSYLFDSRTITEQRGWGQGVWEEAIEAQIATNEAVIAEADAMDIAGKVVIKTNKKHNVPTALALTNGEFIDMEPDEYMDPMSFTPSGLPYWKNIVNEWFMNLQRQLSTYNSIAGAEMKSRTPFSAMAVQTANAGSIFNKFRDADGYFLLKVLDKWVLPFIIEEINKQHELTGAYSSKELDIIDQSIHARMQDDYILKALPSGAVPSPFDLSVLKNSVGAELSKRGTKRKLSIPKGYITIEKIRQKIKFDITGEMSDSQSEINALTQRLQNLAPEDPARAEIIDQLSELAGLSPVSVYSKSQQPTNPKAIDNSAAQDMNQTPDKVTALLPTAQQ